MRDETVEFQSCKKCRDGNNARELAQVTWWGGEDEEETDEKREYAERAIACENMSRQSETGDLYVQLDLAGDKYRIVEAYFRIPSRSGGPPTTRFGTDVVTQVKRSLERHGLDVL